MPTRILTLCAWCGPATVVIALTGWLIAGVLPIPLGPESSVEHVVNFYSHDTRVLTGLVVGLVSAMSLIRDRPEYLWPGLALLAIGAAGMLSRRRRRRM